MYKMKTLLFHIPVSKHKINFEKRTYRNYMFIKFSHVKVTQRVYLIQQMSSGIYPGVELPSRSTMFDIRKSANRGKGQGSWAGPKRTVRTPENLQ